MCATLRTLRGPIKAPLQARAVSAIAAPTQQGAERESARFEDWACLHISLVWVYEGRIRPEGLHLTLEDPYIRCWLIRKGRVFVTAGRSQTAATAGQWVILNGGRHTQDFSDDAEILSVKFQLNWPGGESLFSQYDTLVFKATEQPELERAAMPLMRLVRKYFPNAHDYLPQLACGLDVYFRVQQLLPPWLLAFTRVMSYHRLVPSRLLCADSRSMEALRILNHHPLSMRFSESALAKKVGLSRAQLNRILTRDFRVSTRKYLERRRRESACEALSHTDIAVKELGYVLGFRHESHFCAWFKRLTKFTPSEFRARQVGAAAPIPPKRLK